MSADTTEQHTADGDNLRARYLPVSRKELRRRREAEKLTEEQAAAEPEPTDQPEVTSDSDHQAEDELARTLEDTAAAEGDDVADEPEPGGGNAPDQDSAENSAPTVVLPAPPKSAEEPARPEEEIADAEAEPEQTPEAVESVGQPEEQSQPDSSTAGSRRARRLLRETESIPRLSPELLAELDATNAEIAVIEDPNRVDPELLKKQQALAAKAMQANQERMRKEHAVAEKERRRRSRERPESQVLTEKMLRDSLEEDPDEMQYFTGQIEPMQAQGAHGLDLNKMVDMTSRQASRRNVLLWVLIILAVLLVAAIVAGIYFFLV